MGMFDFLRRLFGFENRTTPSVERDAEIHKSVEQLGQPEHHGQTQVTTPPPTANASATQETRSSSTRSVKLQPLIYQPSIVPTHSSREVVETKPYRFASPSIRTGEYLDLSKDSDERWLEYYGLPKLTTPDEIAQWCQLTTGQLAWLTHRFRDGRRPKDERDAHYHFRWLKKKSAGWRLIEAPKEKLKDVQRRILSGILEQIPAHSAAHGFVSGRSILSNAAPHIGSRFLIKIDLEDFYPSVKYSRVVAIYRSLGFSREASLWLARLCVSAIPWSVNSPAKGQELLPYSAPHLPQGAPTSPALANLSAYALDVRLSGLAKSYRLKYTRYADDLTFSGPGLSVPALREFIPLAKSIIRDERFTVNERKLKVVRNNQQQCVTGVVVNEKLNVSRHDFDLLKAILYNCVKLGPQSQNREQHPNFAAHLRGRIAHVTQLNSDRGDKLMTIYNKIRW